MMLFSFLLFFVLFSQTTSNDTRCDKTPLCYLTDNSTIICDRIYGQANESDVFPSLSCFPPVKTYLFRNFPKIRLHAFEDIKFPESESFSIKLINVSFIETEAFSKSLIIPPSSKLSIDIGDFGRSSSIVLRFNAFNHIKIDHLHFININNFNGRSVFDTDCFGNDLDINLLTFENCAIDGFSNIIRKAADVAYLSIRNSPGLTQLTDKSLPSFLSTSKSLEISNTNLKMINAHTFQAWSLILEELIITNNSNLETFPSNIVDGILMKLNTLDLSYNSIKNLDIDYDWFSYSSTKYLLLRNQQLDLFLKTNLLKTLPALEKIDFSQGFISANNDDLIKNHFPNISNLNSIDVSYTNLTENMIIDLLTSISISATHFIDVRLFGHTLSDKNFCSYFKIFKNAPDLLHLELDESHDCNCIIDLFYMNNVRRSVTNTSVLQPTCLSNFTRIPCDVETQLLISKCHIGSQNPDTPGGGNKIGKYAFGFIVAGIVVVVMVLLSLGFSVVYRIRRRRNTDLDMDQPIENPLAAIIEERLQNQ
ncbi:unnamed protein product [Rotaria magnacalcarata]|uniref:Uncharacterized protein n=1 Tax=Rotaria magnacalcarata TaxID=392030 RepID=A0A819AQX5_9BILA|nr:unnamed protein product [Rotaria magnacalcarata]CAF1433574.1 unnamed protein product [Rotaria magnacalcarata]CAF1980947.1 unnamed protein product [Rotaria magnacalcarata]CAF2080547.1 unnamed protein product [Rotaria magnacalcarata]CAF2108327.1 unnamed protein product [Rotaria magnacalcarata]